MKILPSDIQKIHTCLHYLDEEHKHGRFLLITDNYRFRYDATGDLTTILTTEEYEEMKARKVS
jgi:hypothetical protein